MCVCVSVCVCGVVYGLGGRRGVGIRNTCEDAWALYAGISLGK